MKVKLKKTQRVIGLGVIALLTGVSMSAFAGGGFQLLEQNVTNMGNAFAGTGAEADDASTEWYNPAGMIRLDNPQFVLSGAILDLNTNGHFTSATDSETLTFTNPTTGTLVTSTVTNTLNGDQSFKPGKSAGIPAFHFVYPICHRIAFGFGASVPFGLETQYPTDSLPSFLATESAIVTADIGPSIAVALSPAFSVGAGLDSQYMSVTLDQQIPLNFGLLSPLIPSVTQNIGSFVNQGDNWGWGWHGGIMYQMSPDTRFGLAYHSQVKHKITGRAWAQLNTPAFALLALPPITFDTLGQFTSNVTLPDYVDLSAYHAFNPQWAVLGSVDYTRWSVINATTATYGANINGFIQQANLVFNFQDSWRLAAGLDYKPAPQWTLRTGVAYDESPIRSVTARTFRLPDADRYWISLGAQYIINREFTVDGGYSHLFVQNSTVNNTQTTSGTIPAGFPDIGGAPFSFAESAAGSFHSSVDEVGLQLTWNII